MKIAVIGAGPAGSTFAYWVKKLHPNYTVDLYEFRTRPKSICAGALGFHALEHLKGKLPSEEVIDKSLENKIYKVKIILEGEHKAEAEMYPRNAGEHLGIVVDRKQFDLLLLKHAIDAGVNYYPSSHVTFASSRTIRVRDMNTGNVDIKMYDMIVDARGSEGFTGQWTFEQHALEQWYVEGNVDPNTIYLFFNTEVIKLGYLWIIPGKGYDKIGYGDIVSDMMLNATSKKNYVMDKIGNRKILGKESTLLPLSGKVVLVKDKIFKIGTAAGLVNPLTGAGIYYAVESAYNLAHSIGDNRYFTYLKYRAKEIIHINEIRIALWLRKRVLEPKVFAEVLKSLGRKPVESKGLYRQVVKYLPKVLF